MTEEQLTKDWEISNLKTPDARCEIPGGTILLGYRGSIAHNMYIPNSDPNSIDDVDIMGVVVAPLDCYLGLREWGSRGTKEYKRFHYDCVFYEARKMFSLLLQGNPNVMSMLWLQRRHYLHLPPLGKRIVDNRHLFVGKHVYNAFAGYAHAQLEKMESRDPAELREYMAVTAELKRRGCHPNHKGEIFDIPEPETGVERDVVAWGLDVLLARLRHYQKKGENIGYLGEKRKSLVLEHGYDSKNAAHCIRLLLMCKEFLATGEMRVFREDAEELLNIKRGKWTLEKVKTLAKDLFEGIKESRDRSALPAEPDKAGAQALLIGILKDGLEMQIVETATVAL